MKFKAIKATIYVRGDTMTIIIPRKVTQSELVETIKSDKLTFGEKAKLVDYKLLSERVELTKENLEIPISEVIFNTVKTDSEILYIM